MRCEDQTMEVLGWQTQLCLAFVASRTFWAYVSLRIRIKILVAKLSGGLGKS